MSEKQAKSAPGTVPPGATPPKRAPRKGTKGAFVKGLSAELEERMRAFIDAEGIDHDLTGAERRRLRGARVRNYGYIDKASETKFPMTLLARTHVYAGESRCGRVA